MSLKLPLFDAKTVSFFLKSLSEFIYCPKKFLEVEKHMKNCTSNCSWTLSLNKIQYFKNLRHCFITTFLLFETHLFPIICCSWLLRYGVPKSSNEGLYKSKIIIPYVKKQEHGSFPLFNFHVKCSLILKLT